MHRPCSTGTPDFDAVKNASFGTFGERANANRVNILAAKRLAFHYILFVHDLLGINGTSGCAELPGNDFVVSLGSWSVVGGHNVGSRDQQAGTFMHELGHNLNLQHGGGDAINCKSNHLSVMSYTRQMNNVPMLNRPLDYSRGALGNLNENPLNERRASRPGGQQTVYGASYVTAPSRACTAVIFPRGGVGR